jgi:hypothetical protein
MYFKSKQLLLSMSFTKRISLVIGAIVMISLSACQPDDDPLFKEETTPQPGEFTYTATINGSKWAAKQNFSLLVKNSTGSPGKEMRLSANSTDNKQLNITLEDGSTGIAGDGIAIKTYLLKQSGTSDASFSFENNNNSSTYTGVYGTVTITQSDAANKKISGTFSCTLVQNAGDTLRITNGIITDLPYDITE